MMRGTWQMRSTRRQTGQLEAIRSRSARVQTPRLIVIGWNDYREGIALWSNGFASGCTGQEARPGR